MDSTDKDIIIEAIKDKIETKKIGKVSVTEASFLLLYEILETLKQIEANTSA